VQNTTLTVADNFFAVPKRLQCAGVKLTNFVTVFTSYVVLWCGDALWFRFKSLSAQVTWTLKLYKYSGRSLLWRSVQQRQTRAMVPFCWLGWLLGIFYCVILRLI